MHEHLARDISLQDLAAVVRLSPFHFARMFKQSTGVTPHQYLVRCRVMRAKELLLANRHSVADVAAQVGFCDQSHLAGHFKRVVGLTPRVFVRTRAPRRTHCGPAGI